MARRHFFILILVLFTAPRWWHRGERTLAACNRLRHIGPSPGMMVRRAIGYTSRSPLVRIDSTLNNARYISGVLRPEALHIIQVIRNSTLNPNAPMQANFLKI
ncbi:uncharacterized protein TNCV_130221 [Trichonephila clavipes]|nr:uncharacterized protein TNCV_130221 [Trichonephila clavipes]